MSNLKIYSVNDAEFSEYGRVIATDTSEIISIAERIPYPEKGSSYVPNLPEFAELPIAEELKNAVFGELPIETGYCYGRNDTLNATEWHTSSEINIAVTDLVLILGKRCYIKENRIDSATFKAFYIKKGTCIEVYATSLHFCPCQVNEKGFGCIVILPDGTNTPLDKEYGDKLLFRKNKWLLAHEENTDLIAKGAVSGIYGENYKITKENLANF